jgi:hypothetical protein
MQRDELGQIQPPALTPRLKVVVELHNSRDGIAFVYEGDFGIEVEATSSAFLMFLHTGLQMGMMRKRPR